MYLSDFGLSKQSLAPTGLTATGQFLGTLDYVAPEQIEGRPVDGRADLYALACATFEMLTGAPPFRRAENIALMCAQLSAPPPLIRERRPDLPPAVEDVITKALAKAPDDRYAGCGEFAAALRAACLSPVSSPTVAGPAVVRTPTEVATPPGGLAGPGAAGAGMAAAGAGGAGGAAGAGWPAGHPSVPPGNLPRPEAPLPSSWFRDPAGSPAVPQSRPQPPQPGFGAQPPGSPRRVTAARVTAARSQPPWSPPPGSQPPRSQQAWPQQPQSRPGGPGASGGPASRPPDPRWTGLPSVAPPPADLTARLGPPGAYQPGRAPGPPVRPPARHRGLAVTLLVAGVVVVLVLVGVAIRLKHRDDTTGTAGGTTPPVTALGASSPATAASSPATSVTLTPGQVVQEYYQLLNEHRYLAAWELGGKNGGSGSYSAYVAGYADTANSSVQIQSVSGDVVAAKLTATQTNGVVKVYQGTYTALDGKITHFHVIQTA